MPLFASTKLLDIACEASGPADGPPVILLHGWPDDARTWDRVLPALHAAGLRTIVPWLRGFGPTRFRAEETMRAGQITALARDLLDLADALGLQRFKVVGHDWGSRATYTAACLAPDRIERAAAISTGWNGIDPGQALPMPQVRNYWYQWYMATERGAALVRDDRETYTRYLWTLWNPGWTVPDAEFAATASSFVNPDWPAITLHSYRQRWGFAPDDPACEADEARIKADPRIRVPMLCLHGSEDPASGPGTSEGKEGFFLGPYERRVLPGVGHFPQRQRSEDVGELLVRFLTGASVG
jgi:pimeloyl-ACP methyl ester carboxylesterase